MTRVLLKRDHRVQGFDEDDDLGAGELLLGVVGQEYTSPRPGLSRESLANPVRSAKAVSLQRSRQVSG